MDYRVLPLAGVLLVACASAPDASEGDSEAEDELRAAKMGVNDVSVMYPLPAAGEANRLIAATASGRSGPILPKSIFAKVPPLFFGQSPYDRLFVTSVRIDPCFAALTDQGAACKNQIRMVLQPIVAGDADVETSADDAAIHAFYDISRDELKKFSERYLALKKASGSFASVPLGVHPLLKKGLDSTFARGVQKLLLEYAGQGNLSRITFLTREGSRAGQWKLGGFDIRGATTTPMKVATLGDAQSQNLTNSGLATFMFDVTPAPVAADNIALLFNSIDAVQATRSVAQKAQRAALRIENPLRHTPDTIDCASCHLTHSRQTVEAKFGFSPRTSDAFSQTSRTLKGANNTNADNLHAFSYFGRIPTVSQRVVNESATVADYINEKVLK